jgi:hypothetical protein
MTIVTRTLYATPSSLPALRGVCDVMAFVRADLWRRYGALGNVGRSAADIRKEVTARGWYAGLAVDGTIRAGTTKDAVNDILSCKAAACAKVRQAIAKRTPDDTQRKRLHTLLKGGSKTAVCTGRCEITSAMGCPIARTRSSCVQTNTRAASRTLA